MTCSNVLSIFSLTCYLFLNFRKPLLKYLRWRIRSHLAGGRRSRRSYTDSQLYHAYIYSVIREFSLAVCLSLIIAQLPADKHTKSLCPLPCPTSFVGAPNYYQVTEWLIRKPYSHRYVRRAKVRRQVTSAAVVDACKRTLSATLTMSSRLVPRYGKTLSKS